MHRDPDRVQQQEFEQGLHRQGIGHEGKAGKQRGVDGIRLGVDELQCYPGNQARLAF